MSLEFLKMVADCSERRFLRTVQRLVADKVPCGIFFAPAVPVNARQVVDSFKNSGLKINCVCVVLDEQKQQFTPVEGETLVSLETFPNLPEKPKYIFPVEGLFTNMFTDYFKRYGADMFSSINSVALEDRYDNYMKHLPDLYDVHEMLADDESKKVFRSSITGKLTNLIKDFRFAPEPQYFLEEFFPTTGDIVIDGGAYDGGTAADFSKLGAEVYAFEMDATNYRNCLAPAEKFGFTIENLGLSNMESDAAYSQFGVGSRKSTSGGGVIGHFTDLDSYVERKNLPRVDYIKLDVEGAELETLQGAAKTIVRCKPKMAISAYHKPEDLWTLPTYIKSLRSDYEFKFRHYRIDCTHYLFNDDARALFRHFGLTYFCSSGAEMVLYCK